MEKMDPSMLLAFLISSKRDWNEWKAAISTDTGRSLIRVAESRPTDPDEFLEGPSPIDEVQTFDDDFQDDLEE